MPYDLRKTEKRRQDFVMEVHARGRCSCEAKFYSNTKRLDSNSSTERTFIPVA